ncbi:peptidoglycan-binding protein [Cellulomonas sp. P22]|uniref:peptidoglycan-binding protein n=1 Tax=Cellulomonas sp. P22 TaxID=3373189 RepID=UPI0037A18606
MTAHGPHRGARLVIVALVVGIGAAGAAGWVAASYFQSPAQREAAASAPPAGPVSVPVVSEALEETASARGVVMQSSTQTIALVPVGTVAVVTEAPTLVGSTVQSGQVLTEVNGRPVMALPGRFAYYRDLVPGDEGPDVTQLQSALAATGYAVRADGVFGSSTERAVKELYRKAGYTVPDEEVEVPAPSVAVDDPAPAPATARRMVVPVSEITAIQSLPATAVTLPAVGTSLGGDPVSVGLTSGDLVGQINVAGSLLVRLTDQTPVRLSRADGNQIAATIVTLPPVSDQTEVAITVRPTEGFTADWLGADILAVFVLQEVQGQSLVVPTAAVVPGGNDPSSVLLQQDNGSFRAVPVTELGTLGGRTAVAPIEAGALIAGDLVRVD